MSTERSFWVTRFNRVGDRLAEVGRRLCRRQLEQSQRRRISPDVRGGAGF